MAETAQLYVPNDDCTTGQCGAEAAFIPQDMGNFALDALFAGLEVDQQCDLGISGVASEIRFDELFPPVIAGAPITLEGVIDVFARRYPDRAQLLDMLVNGEGYQIEFVDNLSGEEARLREQIRRESDTLLRLGLIPGGGVLFYRDEYKASLERLRDSQYRLETLRYWRIADRRIIISTRINKNIDKFNWFFGMEDDDLIHEDVTNDDGAEWLHRVMGDWMVRSGIPGAGAHEEFSDSWSSRVIWGSLNVIVGAAEVVGGVVVAAGASWTGVGLLAGGAMTIAGIEALTQGIDMLRTPVQSAHQTGWLGDAALAMGEKFGFIDQNNQQAFTKYWAFTMLGLSLGGAGVSSFLPTVRASMQGARTAQNLSFLARNYDRSVNAARLTLVGIRNARFGRMMVSFAAMPSGRILLNIRGVGRVVAEAWESIPRLRLRLTIALQPRVLERARRLRSGEAGLLALRNAVRSQNQARILVYDVARRMGLSGPELDRLISSVSLGARGQSSAFRPLDRSLRIADDIGTARYTTGVGAGQYNELIAINEVAHEIAHAQRFARWTNRGGTAEEFWVKYGRSGPNGGRRYYLEEIRIETEAIRTTEAIVTPRIALARATGNTAEADRLAHLLEIAKRDSAAYVAANRGKLGQ